MIKRGNCYYSSEAIYHLVGGKKAGWKPMYMNTRATGRHWFLKHSSGLILDVTKDQFDGVEPDYEKAKGCGFLTRKPSKEGAEMMERMVWRWTKR